MPCVAFTPDDIKGTTMQKHNKLARKPVANAIDKAARKPGKVVEILTPKQRVARCVIAFAEWHAAEGVLAEAKAYWDVARMLLRDELKAGRAQFATPKQWGEFLKLLNPALVKDKIVADVKAARKLVNNQLQALGLLGGTERAGQGGRKPGAGRKEKVGFTATKKGDNAETQRELAIAYCKEVQAKGDEFDREPAEMAADLLRIFRVGKK